MRVIIIGAGFAGAAAAFLLREQHGADVTLFEHAPEPGGMLRTYRTKEGLPYEYGPRVVSVFRGTQDALPFFRRFLDLQERDIYQGTRLRPEYDVVPFPVDRESLLKLPCGDTIKAEWAALAGATPDETNLKTYLESTVGPTLTSLAFEPFNLKFWGRRISEMPAQWGKLRRLERIADSGNYRLPSVAPHYYPKGGFTPLFSQLLDGVDIRYGVTVKDIFAGSPTTSGPVVVTNQGQFSADLVLSSAPIDAVMGRRFGELEWKGYRVETQTIHKPAFGRAPDGVPFSWLYTPWLETPVCRTTDFGVIHHGNNYNQPSVLLREIVDNSVKMYPVWWEDEKFYAYLKAASQIPGLVPLGRLGMYKYVTMDSTYGMVQRLLGHLTEFERADAARRYDILRDVRGDWAN